LAYVHARDFRVSRGPPTVPLTQTFFATLQYLEKKNIIFFDPKNVKKTSSNVAHNWPKFFFEYSQLAQNQPKSHNLIISMLSAQLLHNDFECTLQGQQEWLSQ
jgi:hypothetical protein